MPILFVLLFVIFYIYNTYKDHRYKKQSEQIYNDLGQTITSKIWVGTFARRKFGRVIVDFEYIVDNTTYKGWRALKGVVRHNYFKGVTFHVIYCKHNPSLYRLLINEKDFKAYNLHQPQELKVYNNDVG